MGVDCLFLDSPPIELQPRSLFIGGPSLASSELKSFFSIGLGLCACNSDSSLEFSDLAIRSLCFFSYRLINLALRASKASFSAREARISVSYAAEYL